MATTRTLPVSGGVITKPALTDTADISVISTDMENIYQEFVSQNNKNSMYTTIADGVDLNTLSDAKIGYLGMSHTHANHPASGTPTTIFIVSRAQEATTYVPQLAFTGNNIFYRMETTSGNWSPWYKIALNSRGWVESGTNIDNLVDPGVYGLSGSYTYGGTLPSGMSGGVLEVIAPSSASSYIIQRLSVGSSFAERYKASSSGAAWGAWYKYTGTIA